MNFGNIAQTSKIDYEIDMVFKILQSKKVRLKRFIRYIKVNLTLFLSLQQRRMNNYMFRRNK